MKTYIGKIIQLGLLKVLEILTKSSCSSPVRLSYLFLKHMC